MSSPVSAGGASAEVGAAQRLGTAALLALPALLTIYLGFNSGGFFVGPTGVAAVVLSIVLAIRITLARRPFAGISAPVLIALAALALYATWVLLSALWSGSSARALLEFDRALLYVLGFAVLGSVPFSAARLEWALRAFAAAVVVVCLAALASRLLPDILPTSASEVPERLSYPVSYWNALGLLAAVGTIVSLHLASGPRQPRLVRALGAAAIPLLATTLFLTFSRGAIAVAVIGLVVYMVLARPWGLVGSLVASGPTAGVALLAAYGAELVGSEQFATAAGIAQGHELATTVVVCALVAGLLRAALTPIDQRLERRAERRSREGEAWSGETIAAGAGLAAALLAVTLIFALDAPARVDAQITRFVEGNSLPTTSSRDRLTSAANNGRLEHWAVAVDAFAAAPLAGQGAGTYQNLWARDRRSSFNVLDGHSLYFESLAELGVVGFGLLAIALLTILGALASRARGRDRSLHAAVLAAILAWAVHAGIDWDWEVPAVTAWVFALGGLAVASPAGADRLRGPAPLTRIVAALGCLLLAVTPALAALSQQQLGESLAAFRRGDCPATIDSALSSISFLSVRPQPFELLAYCDVRAGRPDLALKAIGRALARDPGNWEYQYGLALVRASAGLDPRPQARAALRLNPESLLAQAAAKAFRTSDPREWRRRAAAARLPIAP